MTLAVAFEARSGSSCATQVTSKGAQDKYAVLKIATWLDKLAYKKVVITTDNEAAVRVLAWLIKAKTSCEASLRTRLKGSPASLAGGETSVAIVAGGVRTIIAELEGKLKVKVPLTCRAMAWAIHHVCWSRALPGQRHSLRG